MEKDIVCSLVLFDLSADYLPPVLWCKNYMVFTIPRRMC
jgi:hypothetical protein